MKEYLKRVFLSLTWSQKPVELDQKQLRDRLLLAVRDEKVEEFWKALTKYILESSDTNKFLGIKNEMGMKGFWYMKGYIRGQRDIMRFVDIAVRMAKDEEKRKTK